MSRLSILIGRRWTLQREVPESERHPDYEEPQALPEDLAQCLTPSTRHALNHPIRRRILRSLNRARAISQTPDDLLLQCPGVLRKTITYHASVLHACGALRTTTDPGLHGAAKLSFTSEIGADFEYHLALVATEHLDNDAR